MPRTDVAVTVVGKDDIRQVVPKGLRDLDAKPKIFMYSIQDNLDKLMGVGKKRDRKPSGFLPLFVNLYPSFLNWSYNLYNC
ncbi:hypothetical protein [Methanomethylophilus alvi]|uniref:hypothetical protein n=1 Tax=Methanomethylophilus alvi TaxID=1291540 RepID=UPI0037DD6DFD